MKLDKQNIKKILVIKFGGLGDILLTTPVFPNIKNAFPDAEVDVLTLRHTRDILIDNPYLKRVFTYDANEDKSWCLIKNIHNWNYDLIIDLFCNPRTALVTFLSRARYRFGFEFRGRSYAYNIKREGRGGEVHNVEFNLDALRELEIPIISKDLHIEVNVVHEDFANEFYSTIKGAKKRCAGITLTGGWEAKRYKTDDYVSLIRKLSEIYDMNFILLWGNKSELEQANLINSKLPSVTYVIPESPIRYLAAIIKQCDFVIGSDSGPLHLASAVGIPTLGIFGPTNPALQGPFGEKNLTIVKEELTCLYCGLLECPIGNVCMTELSQDLIIDKVKQLLDINKIEIPEKILSS